jgi:hypothetical protein
MHGSLRSVSLENLGAKLRRTLTISSRIYINLPLSLFLSTIKTACICIAGRTRLRFFGCADFTSPLTPLWAPLSAAPPPSSKQQPHLSSLLSLSLSISPPFTPQPHHNCPAPASESDQGKQLGTKPRPASLQSSITRETETRPLLPEACIKRSRAPSVPSSSRAA